MADDLHKLKLELALLGQKVQHLKEDFDDQVEKFVTHDQFYSVRLLTHGLAGIIFTSVVGALIMSILK